MDKKTMIGIILAHYYGLVAEYHSLRNTMDWEKDYDINALWDVENNCLRMEKLLIELEISFISIYGQVYKDGQLCETEG